MNNRKTAQKDNKGFPLDKIVGFLCIGFIVFLIVYVIMTHVNYAFIVPSDAIEMTYPASLFESNVEDMAESMKGTDGVYRVKVNTDGSLTVKISPERHNKIKEAAANAANVVPLSYISEETAIKSYEPSEDNTEINISVIKNAPTLEKEVSDIVYILRLYHVCNNNYGVKINVYYTDVETGEHYMTDVYDITGESTTTIEYDI